MRIKKFKVTYGGYFDKNYELKKHRNTLVFKQWNYFHFEIPPTITKLSRSEWTTLIHQVVDIIKDWNPMYHYDMCDGTNGQ